MKNKKNYDLGICLIVLCHIRIFENRLVVRNVELKFKIHKLIVFGLNL